MNFEKMIEMFINHILIEKNLSLNTAYAYKNDLFKFKSFIEQKNIDINKLDYEIFTSFIIFLKKMNYSSTSIVRTISGIFINFLLQEDI